MPRKTIEERREYQCAYKEKQRDNPELAARIREQRRASAARCYDPARQAAGVLRRKYKLTPETYQAKLVKQNYACAICKTKEPGGSGDRFRVDHCHITGEVRGLLCHACNVALGMMGESTISLRAAIAYLEEWA